MTQPESSVVRIPAQRLQSFVKDIFLALGLRERDAELVADVLVRADLRGVSSHGVLRVPVYVERLRKGLVIPQPKISVVRSRGPIACLDAGNGPGPVGAFRGMEEAIKRAKECGVGLVGVVNSNHCGMMAYYVLQAVEAGMLGIALSNAPATMAPWGAAKAYLGTNPLAIGVPTPGSMPLVLDMAMSVTARGKIIQAAQEGREIPEGWALGPDGKPTRNPRDALAGVILPFGGAKGSGLALMVEVLTGVLLGGPFGPHLGPLYDNPHKPQGISHLFVAIDPGAFGETSLFLRRVEQLVSEIHSLPPIEGQDRVYLPGEKEWINELENQQKGVPLTSEVLSTLARVAREVGVREAPWSAKVGEEAFLNGEGGG